MSKLLEENPILELLSKYPWLGEIQHNISDFNAHLEGLNKKFNQQLYKQMICSGVFFKLDILDKYKDKFLKAIPFSIGGNVAQNYIFQIENNLIVCFMMGKLNDIGLAVVPDFHSTCMSIPYNFILDNTEFIVEPNKKPLGFGG